MSYSLNTTKQVNPVLCMELKCTNQIHYSENTMQYLCYKSPSTTHSFFTPV